jgi:hypothetical protein
MSEIAHLLRPQRLLRRCPDLMRVMYDVPGYQTQFALELLTNQLLVHEAEPRQTATMDRSLEHPIGAMMGEFVAVVSYMNADAQTFVFAKPVVEELRKTDVGHVRVSDLRLPFDAFFIAFEEPVAVCPGYLCEGAYFWKLGADEIYIRVALLSDRTSVAEWLPDPGVTMPVLNAEETLEQLICTFLDRLGSLTRDSANDPYAHMTVEFRNLSIGLTNVPSKPTSERLEDFQRANGEAFANCLATVLGAACLLTAVPEEMVRPNVIWPRPVQARPGTSHKTIRGAVPVRYISFGASDSTGHGTGERFSPRAHWRRGHWRRQPFGPASDRAYRPTWIRPTLVSPDHGPVAEASVYRVNE